MLKQMTLQLINNDNDNDRWLGHTAVGDQSDSNHYNKIQVQSEIIIKFTKLKTPLVSFWRCQCSLRQIDQQERCSTLSERQCWTHVCRTWVESIGRAFRCWWPIEVQTRTCVQMPDVARLWRNPVWCRQQRSADRVYTDWSCYRQPVQLPQCWCDMVPWPEVAEESHSSFMTCCKSAIMYCGSPTSSMLQ